MMRSSGPEPIKSLVVCVDVEIEDLVPGFLERRQEDIKAILEGCLQRDFETIRVLAHNMKGSGGGYGFDVISDLGRCLEQGAKEQDSNKINQLVGHLSAYLERVEVIYV